MTRRKVPNVMRGKNISYSELTSVKASEIKDKYKLNERQLEQAVNRHCMGAPKNEKQEFYKSIYEKK